MIRFVTLLLLWMPFILNASVEADNQSGLLLNQTSFGITNDQQMASCDVSVGMADSYVLAMSSQTGFCQTYGYEAGKPECLHLSKNAYESHHLVLHGLWPNQVACGQHYGFCGIEPKSSHCSYPPVPLSKSVDMELKNVMPSYKHGSCLERHEWYKHGSCQMLTSDEYFKLAMKLMKQVDNSQFGEYLTENYGKSVRLSEIRDSISKAYGTRNNGKIYLGCKNGVLVDVFISLPAYITDEVSLKSLINEAPDYQYYDACPKNVLISSFHKFASEQYVGIAH